jgi:hypothetical protein
MVIPDVAEGNTILLSINYMQNSRMIGKLGAISIKYEWIMYQSSNERDGKMRQPNKDLMRNTLLARGKFFCAILSGDNSLDMMQRFLGCGKTIIRLGSNLPQLIREIQRQDKVVPARLISRPCSNLISEHPIGRKADSDEQSRMIHWWLHRSNTFLKRLATTVEIREFWTIRNRILNQNSPKSQICKRIAALSVLVQQAQARERCWRPAMVATKTRRTTHAISLPKVHSIQTGMTRKRGSHRGPR